MKQSEFMAALAAGKVTIETEADSASDNASSAAATPTTPIEQFVPMLTLLESVQPTLSAAPTFVPQTFQDQIQPVFDGTNYYLYIYFNNQWNKFSVASAGGSSISGLANGTASSSIPSGNDTKVQLNNLGFASGITWNSGSNRFVVQTAGNYLITGIATYSSTTSGKQYQTEISINGNAITPGASAKCYFQASVTGGAAGPCVSTIVSLNVGDYIELYTWHNVGSNAFIYNLPALTYLAVAKV